LLQLVSISAKVFTSPMAVLDPHWLKRQVAIASQDNYPESQAVVADIPPQIVGMLPPEVIRLAVTDSLKKSAVELTANSITIRLGKDPFTPIENADLESFLSRAPAFLRKLVEGLNADKVRLALLVERVADEASLKMPPAKFITKTFLNEAKTAENSSAEQPFLNSKECEVHHLKRYEWAANSGDSEHTFSVFSWVRILSRTFMRETTEHPRLVIATDFNTVPDKSKRFSPADVEAFFSKAFGHNESIIKLYMPEIAS
jgi:hypothetical protein